MRRRKTIKTKIKLSREAISLHFAQNILISSDNVSLATAGGDDVFITKNGTSLSSYRERRRKFYRHTPSLTCNQSCAVAFTNNKSIFR